MNAALPDRVRVIRRPASGHKVYGERQTAPKDRGPWIRCRLEEYLRLRTHSANSGGQTAEESRSRFVKQLSILISNVDEHRQPVEILPTDMLEVESEQFGNNDGWKFQGIPRAVRKKRRIHHWEGTVVLVQEG